MVGVALAQSKGVRSNEEIAHGLRYELAAPRRVERCRRLPRLPPRVVRAGALGGRAVQVAPHALVNPLWLGNARLRHVLFRQFAQVRERAFVHPLFERPVWFKNQVENVDGALARSSRVAVAVHQLHRHLLLKAIRPSLGAVEPRQRDAPIGAHPPVENVPNRTAFVDGERVRLVRPRPLFAHRVVKPPPQQTVRTAPHGAAPNVLLRQLSTRAAVGQRVHAVAPLDHLLSLLLLSRKHKESLRHPTIRLHRRLNAI